MRNDSESKKRLFVAVMTLFVIVLCIYTFIYRETYNSIKIDTVKIPTVEYGSPNYDLNKLINNVDGKIISVKKDIETNEVGKQELILVVSKGNISKEIPVSVEIKDSVAPKIVVKEETVVVDQGDIIDLQSVTVAGKPLMEDITISIDDLSDVTITTPTAGQGLVYDAANKVWKNSAITASSVAWTGVTGRPTSVGLTGDITGSVTLGSGANTITAAIAAGSIVNDDISDSAAISMSKISGLNTALSGKVDNTITVNGQPLTSNVQINDISGNAATASAVAWSGITGKPSINVTGAVTGTLDLSASTPTLSTTLRALTDADIPTGITASKISGALTNATISGSSVTGAVASATKATQDAAGNVITETYATKNELSSSALVWGTF